MSATDLLEPIRVRAYFLWEKAGRPEGGDMAFWDDARIQLDREAEEAASLAGEG